MSEWLQKLEPSPEKKEEQERKLPEILKNAGQQVIQRYIEDQARIYTLSGDPEVQETIMALEKINWDEAVKTILAQGEGRGRLEAIALLDASEGNIDRTIVEVEGLQNLQDTGEEAEDLERRAVNLEEREDVKRGFDITKNLVAEYRDWLIEDIPELRTRHTRDEFRKWIKNTAASYNRLRGNAQRRGEEETADSIKKNLDLLEQVWREEPLTMEERNSLLDFLNKEILVRRVSIGEQLARFFLREGYEREKLLNLEKQIIKLRQFAANVEGRTWVKIQKR